MSLLPARKNFKIWKDASFHYRLTYLSGDEDSSPKNLTGYSGTLTIKDEPNGTVLLTLNSPNDIVFGGSAGTIDILIPYTTTTALTWISAVYELLIQAPSNGEVTPLLTGTFSVHGL